MANDINWGQGVINNAIGWGQGASSNSISWGISQKDSYSGETEIYGIRTDADALAFYSKVTTAGGTLTATEQTAINQLVVDLKAKGLWASMKAIYPMVGSSAASCAQNLVSSSFTATFYGGWTFTSSGALPNGTNAYMDTFLVPNSTLNVNSTHLSLYLNTNNVVVSGDPIDIGGYNSGTQALTLLQSNTILNSRNLGSFISYTQINRLGFGITSKISSTLTTLYKNGTSVSTGNSGGTLPIVKVYLGTLALGDNTPYSAGYTNNKIAFSSIGLGLTNTQASDFYTAVQTFNTTLSRQV